MTDLPLIIPYLMDFKSLPFRLCVCLGCLLRVYAERFCASGVAATAAAVLFLRKPRLVSLLLQSDAVCGIFFCSMLYYRYLVKK